MPDPSSSPPPLTPARVFVSILILIACGLTIALFVTPGQSPWFWWLAGGIAVTGGVAMLVPIKGR